MNEELRQSKERHLKDLKELSSFYYVKGLIWVNATIRRLEKELKKEMEKK